VSIQRNTLTVNNSPASQGRVLLEGGGGGGVPKPRGGRGGGWGRGVGLGGGGGGGWGGEKRNLCHEIFLQGAPVENDLYEGILPIDLEQGLTCCSLSRHWFHVTGTKNAPLPTPAIC